jgi:DnaJ family protein C protein 19
MAKLLLVAALALVAWLWWRGRSGRPTMPLSEARALLDVPEDASSDEIRAAHRRIIARVHPDAGGSPELARRTNLARDLLLAELDRRPPANP